MAQRVSVTILVSDRFIPTELALVQDVLRIANRLAKEPIFETRICTSDQTDLVEGQGGILVRAAPFAGDNAALPDHLVVLGGKGVRDCFDRVRARLRQIERMGRNIILLSDAASEWQSLNPDADHTTTHWELQQIAGDATCSYASVLPLFAGGSRVTTGAGMISTADLILNRIVTPWSLRLAQAVSQVLLMDQIRDGTATQPRSENDVSSLKLAGLEPVIAAMEDNLETPLKITDLAQISGYSMRQLERKFQVALGQSPVAFYRSVRLKRAHNLIERTDLPVSEVALACGLGNASSFAKAYRREFGMSPSRRRAQMAASAPALPLTPQSKGTQNAPVPFPASPPCPSCDPAGADEAPVRRIGR